MKESGSWNLNPGEPVILFEQSKRDGMPLHHPDRISLAQVSLVEGDIEEAITLAEESCGMDDMDLE